MVKPKQTLQKRSRQEDVTIITPEFLSGQKTKSILDLLDNLRENGIHDEIALPCVVVAGDTSSGKSSVLSRLIGLPFPKGEGVVTKFVTEVSMRHANTEEIRVTIIPDKARKQDQIEVLKKFIRHPKINEFAQIHAEASATIDQQGNRKGLLRDVLRIEMKGPECSPLTLIDLPGLIQATSNTVSEEDMRISHQIIQDYLKGPRTIILTVISALNDVVNQAITKIAREHDPECKRILGIITKPDAAQTVPEKEQSWMELAMNQTIPLKLGWHVLVNKIEGQGIAMSDATADAISAAEKKFFGDERFAAVGKCNMGLESLRARVIKLVDKHLTDALPELEKEVRSTLNDRKIRLDHMGNSRADTGLQRKFLLRISKDFEAVARIEIEGMDAESLNHVATSKRKLRADIEELHWQFTDAMRYFGAKFRLQKCGNSGRTDMDSLYGGKSNEYRKWADDCKIWSQDEALKWVSDKQKDTRGNELAGSVNPLAVSKLFKEMSSNWERFARIHMDRVFNLCEKFVIRTSENLAGETAKDVIERVEIQRIEPTLQAAREKAILGLAELVKDEKRSPKTYNPRFSMLMNGSEKLEIFDELSRSREWFPSLKSSLDLVSGNKPDVAKATAESTFNQVTACYDTLLVSFIDNTVKQVVEREIVEQIPQILSFDWASDLTDEEIMTMASESDEVALERKELEETIKKMEHAIRQFKTQRTKLHA